MTILKLYWDSLRHLNQRGYLYIWANLLWIALTALVITAPAAWAGLSILTHKVHTQAQVSLDDFWQGFRQHFWRALLLGLISLLIALINITNLLFVDSDNLLLLSFLRLFWIATLLIWFSSQFFFWTLWEEMAEPSIFLVLRNSLIMCLRHPFILLSLWLVLGLVGIFSIAMPPAIILLSGSVIAIFFTQTALYALARAGYDKRLRAD